MIEESLQIIEARFAELEAKSMDPAAHADARAATLLMKEYRSLLPMAEKIKELRTTQADAREARMLCESEQDRELLELAALELRELSQREEQLLRELQIMLIARKA